VLGTPPAFTLSQDQTLQFFSEVLKFRLYVLRRPEGSRHRVGLAPVTLRFRSWFRSAPGIRACARYPFGFKLSVGVSCDSPPKSSSKDSRKLFNPHLLSQTRTDVSVQFSRNRRRPAAGRRILAEALFGVKRKVKRNFTFSCFSRFGRHPATKAK
ncbi:MAG: hypothetical protein PT977_11830, partial [Acidobacteriota bacterium]|nr:hypothetical protein [Acidobacteriota bacterium]